ncbi:MAG: hypothetical protein QOI37_66 [Chloroflexota bacterium]|jgi:hypothetical protein|nr:hypothetical protein [Chloroflexota bacterium]
MTRREALLTALSIFAVALVARIVVASVIVFPKPEDTAYYYGVARNLVEGRGLVSDALWTFATPTFVLPHPAFEVWLPLPSLLAAIPMAILGTSFQAAQVSSVLIGSIVPVLAWILAADVAAERGLALGRARTLAVGTGLTTAVYLPLLLNSALPDSTMPFTALVLAACLLMTRIARDPRGGRLADPRLIALGIVLGLNALTRNETVWLALIWAGIAWFGTVASRAVRLRLVAIVAVVAALVFAPWAYRNLLVFGSPLPSGAATNALYLSGFDIFAWHDRPTLARYLAIGPARLLELRWVGITHNLLNVLLFLGLPISLVGMIGLPRLWASFALRPLLLISVITFLFTSLVFPAATQWGTFLHGAGPVHVLLVVSALFALDGLIAWVGTRRGWTNPVAWLGPTLGIFGSVLFSVVLLASFASGSAGTARVYTELHDRMAAAGHPLDASAGPVISNFPIWLAETQRIPTLALPDEPPADVLDMTRSFPGAHLLLVIDPQGKHWPADIAGGLPDAGCFRPIDLGRWSGPAGTDDPLSNVFAFEVVCP